MRKAFISITLVAILTAILLPGCTRIGAGATVTETKDFTNFTQVEVEDMYEVEIVQSNSFSTTIIADKDLSDYLAASQEGETLRIYINPHHPFTNFAIKPKTLKAKINMPLLSKLHLSGATRGTVTGFKSPQDFTLKVSGASSLNIDDIEVGNVQFEISGASKVTGTIKASDARFEVAGASKVELKGSANNLVLNATGASNLNLADFTLNTANVNLSGASEATINAKERLVPTLSDASTLYFHGNPTIDNMNISGASTIKHK